MLSWTSWLEVESGESVKFWRARAEGENAYMHHGVVGTPGTTQIARFLSHDDAHHEIVALTEKQRSEGYKDPREVFLDWAGSQMASVLSLSPETCVRSADRAKYALPAPRGAFLRVAAPEHRPRRIDVSVQMGNAHGQAWP